MKRGLFATEASLVFGAVLAAAALVVAPSLLVLAESPLLSFASFYPAWLCVMLLWDCAALRRTHAWFASSKHHPAHGRTGLGHTTCPPYGSPALGRFLCPALTPPSFAVCYALMAAACALAATVPLLFPSAALSPDGSSSDNFYLACQSSSSSSPCAADPATDFSAAAFALRRFCFALAFCV